MQSCRQRRRNALVSSQEGSNERKKKSLSLPSIGTGPPISPDTSKFGDVYHLAKRICQIEIIDIQSLRFKRYGWP